MGGMGGGGGGMGAGGYLGIMGGALGGIGDIIQGASYEQPKFKQATGMEQRLRQLAQSQLLGGGQQLLGATALYNQMAPILMSQLPGMHYVPPTGDMGGGGGGGTGAGQSLSSYQDQLRQLQEGQQRQQQLTALKAQRKGAPKGQKKQYQQQIKALKREIKSNPTVAQSERQAYMAGAQPGSYDIRMGPPSGGPPATPQTSLGDINALLASLGSHPDLTSIYRGGY